MKIYFCTTSGDTKQMRTLNKFSKAHLLNFFECKKQNLFKLYENIFGGV